MSKRKKLLINIILITMMVLLVLVSTLLYINYYPRVSIHLISDNELYDTLQIKKNSSIPALKKPEKEGYKFVGWFTDQECTDPFKYNESLSNDVELYAKFEAIDYSLTYNCVLDGVVYTDIYDSVVKHINDYVRTPDGSEEIVINGRRVTLNNAKLGYSFAGWSTTQNANSAACGAGGDFLMPASNVNLFAVWEPNTYDVSFYIQDLSKDANVVVDSDGFVRYNSQNQLLYKYMSYKYSYKMEEPDAPTNEKGYYQFVGWYLDENFEKAVIFDQVYMGLNQLSNSNLSPIHNVDNSKPIVLFAKWQVVKFNVLFSLNKDARPGSIYSISDSSIMVPDSNGSVLSSDYFKAKRGFYYKSKMGTIDGGLYSSSLLEGKVYYSTNTSIVSHKFLGWFTEKNGGVEYNTQTAFDPEDFNEYYTNRDPGFSFLEPGVRTYILYANWEEYLHISYKYNNKTYDNQPVSENSLDKLRDVSSMPQIVRDGYYFGGWSRTSSNSDGVVYDTKTNYKFITNAAQMGENTFLFANGVRSVSLYPYWKPNEYHIKYDFSINTLADGNITCVEKDPQNIDFSDYLADKIQAEPVVRYNTKVDGQWENHIVYNSINTEGISNATYVAGSIVYLLSGWALVDNNNKVLATYNDGEMLTASSKQSDLYKYSAKVSSARDNGEYTFTIKAIWTTQVVVSFDKGFEDVEGDVPESIKTMTGKNISIPTGPNPTRPYHIFKGWVLAKDRFTSNGVENYTPTTRYVSRNSVAFATDTILYASWEPIKYTLNIYNTNVDGSRSSRIAQIGMTYKDFGVNISKVTLGQTISFGTENKTIVNPSGYALEGFTMSAGGDVVFANGTDITISTKYDDADGNKVALFDPIKSNTINIFVKYSIKEYTINVEVKDPEGNALDGFETIVVEKVRHGVAINDFIDKNKIKTKISLPDGIVYDYWKISVTNENINDIDKCFVEIQSDMTITLYTKIETFTLTLNRRNPVTNKLNDPVVYENIKYGTLINDISGLDTSLESYFGYEIGKWYRNGEIINLDDFVISSDITLVSGYDAKEINIVYHKSTDSSESISNTTTVTFAQNFNLPDQSIDEGFKVNNMALNKWTLVDGKDFGKTFENVELTLKYLAEKLSISEDEVEALFSDVEGTLTLNLYAGYAQIYYLSFASSDGTFRYDGSSSKKEQYVSGDEIDLITFVRENISNIIASSGYVYNGYWKVVGEDDNQFDVTQVKYAYIIAKDVEIVPVIEKERYTIQFVAEYGENDTQLIENLTLTDKTLGDSFQIPSATDIQSILVHNGVSYRALKWYLNNNMYEMGASITIDDDIIAGNYSTYIVVKLHLAQLRSFIYNVDKQGVANITVTGATGDVIKLGYDKDNNPFALDNENYADRLVGWKIGDMTYNIGDEYEITDNTPKVFNAVWETKKITIVYHANNGTDAEYTQEIGFGIDTSLALINSTGFAKEMFRITSWNEQADGTGKTLALDASVVLKLNGEYHLYAQWTRVYEIKYSDGTSTQTDAELLYEGKEFVLPSAEAYATAFVKDGHYINGWKYGSTTFAPNETVDVEILGSPSTKDIVFEVVWGADTLTVSVVYTNADGTQFSSSQTTIDYGKTPEIVFDTSRQTIFDASGIQYTFVYFKDANNKKYNVVDGKIVIGTVTQALTLTTVYEKVLKLTYDLSAFGKTNQVFDTTDGEIVGVGVNNTPFLEISDKVAGKVHVGWVDQNGNQYKILTGGSGYNYVKNMADHFTMTTNVTLSPMLLDEYKLVVWKNLTSTGEFVDKDEYTLVEGDTNDFVFGDEYNGFVMSDVGFTYDPNVATSYGAVFTFELTNIIANQFSASKEIHLYPIKTITVTFKIEALGYEKQVQYKAGEVVSLPADAQTTEAETAYFDSWILEDGTIVDFYVQNRYYLNTTIIAVYKDFYSVQYRGAEQNQDQAESKNNFKIKLNESFALMSESEATAIYQKTGHTLKGFYLCYSEDGVGGDHNTKKFEFGETFVVSQILDGMEQKYLFVYPAWERATMNIWFADNTDTTEFTYSNNKDYADDKIYTVEAGSAYKISGSDSIWSITFTHIIGSTTEEVTVSITANRVSVNNSITGWTFNGTDVKSNGEFDFTNAGIEIGFKYDADAVTLNVTVAHNDQNVDWEILTIGGVVNSSVSYSAKSGSLNVSITVKNPSNTNKVYMLDSWYIKNGDTSTKLSDMSRDDIEISNDGWTLTITGLKDSATLYVNFIDGYVKITQTTEFVDGRDYQPVSINGTLSARYIQGVQKVGSENCNTSLVYTLTDSLILSVNPKATLDIKYSLETTENWKIYGVYIVETGKFYQDQFTLTTTDSLTLKVVVVPKTITISFTGYDGAVVDTKNTYTYNDNIGTLSDVQMPSDVEVNGIKYTFVKWQFEGKDIDLNTVLTRDITISSNWERLYKVVLNDGSTDKENWLIYRDDNANLSSTNGNYYNFVELRAVTKANYSHNGFVIEAYKDGASIKSLNTASTKLYSSYLKNDFIENDLSSVDYIKISPTYEKLYTIIVNNEDGSIKETLTGTYKVSDKISVENPTKTGYSFDSWNITYSGIVDAVEVNNLVNTSLADCNINPENNIILTNGKFEIYLTPKFTAKTYDISFATNNSTMGTVSSTANYTIKYGTTITFAFNVNGGTATFVDSHNNQVTITYTSLNGNTFTGFYDSLTSAVKFADSIVYKYETDLVVYGIYKFNPVEVTATLKSRTGSEEYMTELLGGSIKVGDSEPVKGVINYNTYSSSDMFEFVLISADGFKLTSVKYEMGDVNTTLNPDASGKYSILLTGDCQIEVLFDALKTSAKVSVKNTTTLSNTPYAYSYLSETDISKVDKTFTSTDAVEISTDYYLKKGTAIVNANQNYYSIDKFTYRVNGGAEQDFSELNIAQVANGYKLTFMYQADSIEIVVYIKAKQLTVTYYDMDLNGNTIVGTKTFDYGKTLTNTDLTNASPKSFGDYRFDKDGKSTTVSTDMVGGLNFKYEWGYKDQNGKIVEIGDNFVLLANTDVYPINEKHYFLTYQSDYALNTIRDNFSASNYITLQKINLRTGYEFVGYKVYLGLDKSVQGITIDYNGTNFVYNLTIVNSCDLSMFVDGHESFATSKAVKDFSIFLEAIVKVKEYEIKFDVADTSLGDGTIEVIYDTTTDVYSKDQIAKLTIPHFYKLQYSVEEGVKTVKVLDAGNVIKYTVRFVPKSACVCGDMLYNKNGGNYSKLSSDVTFAVEAPMNFSCVFNNADGHVDFVFNVDANIRNEWILALTINSNGDNIEYIIGSYNENGDFEQAGTNYTNYNNKQLKYNELKVLRVIMERTKSFTYSIEYNTTYYTNSAVNNVSYTIINDGSEKINISTNIKSYDTNCFTYFYNGATSQDSADYGHALVHFKSPIKVNNYITGYEDSTVDSISSGFTWYEGDEIYLTAVNIPDGFELRGIYDGVDPNTSNSVATKNSSENRYVINSDYKGGNVYVIIQEREIELTFAIATPGSEGAPEIVVSEKKFKATDVSGFKAYAKGLTTYNDMSLNEYLVSGIIDPNLKTKFANVMIQTKVYGEEEYNWDIDNHIINGVLNSDTPVLAVTTSAVLITISTDSVERGYFTYKDINANKNKLYIQYSSTQKGDSVYESVTFKVVTNTNYSAIPSITPKANGGYEHIGYSITENGATRNIDGLSGEDATNEADIKVLFSEKIYTIKINIVDNNGNKICEPFTYSYSAKANFNTIRQKLVEDLQTTLSDLYGGNNGDGYVYNEANEAFKLLEDCVDKNKYYYSNIPLYYNGELFDDEKMSSSIWNYESELSAISVVFTAENKVGFEIKDDLVSSIDNYEGRMFFDASLSGYKFHSTNKLCIFYFKQGVNVNISNIYIYLTDGTTVKLGEYATYANNFGYVATDKKYAHLDLDGTEELLNIFNYDSVTGERSLANGGRPVNNNVVMTRYVVLYTLFIDTYQVKMYLDADNIEDNYILSDAGVSTLKLAQNSPVYLLTCFDGQLIDENTVLKILKNTTNFANCGVLYEVGNFYTVNSQFVKDTEWNGGIVTQDLSIVNIVSILRGSFTAKVKNQEKYLSTSINVEFTLSYLSKDYETMRYFAKGTYVNNTAPYLWDTSAQNWALNSVVDSSVWTYERYTFYGYAFSYYDGDTKLNGIIGVKDGTITLNGITYNVFAYNSDRSLVSTGIKEFTAVYIGSNDVTIGRVVDSYKRTTTNISGTLKTTESLVGSRKYYGSGETYDYEYNRYGFMWKITYTNIDGKTITNNYYYNDAIMLENVLIDDNSQIIIKFYYSSWYVVDDGEDVTKGQEEINGHTYMYAIFTYINNDPSVIERVIKTKAIYVDAVVQEHSNYNVVYNETSNKDMFLFGTNTSTNWEFPYGLDYTITTNGTRSIESVLYSQSVYDPSFSSSSTNTFEITPKGSYGFIVYGPDGKLIEEEYSKLSGTLYETQTGVNYNNVVYVNAFYETETLTVTAKYSDTEIYVDTYSKNKIIAVFIYDTLVYDGRYYKGMSSDYKTFGTNSSKQIKLDDIINKYKNQIYNLSNNASYNLESKVGQVTYTGCVPNKTLNITKGANVSGFSHGVGAKNATISFEWQDNISSEYTITLNGVCSDTVGCDDITFLSGDIEIPVNDYVEDTISGKTITLTGVGYENGKISLVASGGTSLFLNIMDSSGVKKGEVELSLGTGRNIDFSGVNLEFNPTENSSMSADVTIKTTHIELTDGDASIYIGYRTDCSDYLQGDRIIDNAIKKALNTQIYEDASAYQKIIDVTEAETAYDVFDYVDYKAIYNSLCGTDSLGAIGLAGQVSVSQTNCKKVLLNNYADFTNWQRFAGISNEPTGVDEVYTKKWSSGGFVNYPQNTSDTFISLYEQYQRFYFCTESFNTYGTYNDGISQSYFDTTSLQEYKAEKMELISGVDIELETSAGTLTGYGILKNLNDLYYRYLPGQTVSHGLQDSDGNTDTNIELSGSLANYNVTDISTTGTNKIQFTFEWKQSAYTVIVFSTKDGVSNNLTYALNQIKGVSGYGNAGYYYVKHYNIYSNLNVTSNNSLDAMMTAINSDTTGEYTDRYRRDMYKISAFATYDPKTVPSVSLYTTLPDFTPNDGYVILYGLYGPDQVGYNSAIFTYSANSITGWAVDSKHTLSFFEHDECKLLIIPEWNFTVVGGVYTAVKIDKIDFIDTETRDYSSYTYTPKDIEYVYIGANIKTITRFEGYYEEEGDISSEYALNKTNGIASIARMTESIDGVSVSNFKGYIVSKDNTNYVSKGSTTNTNTLITARNILSSSNTEGADNTIEIGYLMSKDETILLHCPPQFAFSQEMMGGKLYFDVSTVEYVDMFAFAYKQTSYISFAEDGIKIGEELYFENIKYVGTGAFYGSASDFASTIKFGAGIEKIGWSVIEQKAGNTDVWFMGNVPFLTSAEALSFYVDEDGNHYSEAILRANPQNAGVTVTVYYQADYDNEYWTIKNEQIDDYPMRSHYNRILLFGTSIDVSNIKYVIIQAPASAFYISGGKIKGILSDKLSSLGSSILMPLYDGNGNIITGVDYVGLVDSSGYKINESSTLREFKTLILNDYSYLGSILDTFNLSSTYSPGVTYNTIRFATGIDMTKSISMGDGVHSPFGDNGAFKVKFVYLERVNEIKNCTTYLPNNTITTLNLSSTSTVSLGENALRNMTALSTLSGQMHSIGDCALAGCIKLETLSGYDESEKGLMFIGTNFAEGSGLLKISFSSDFGSIGGIDIPVDMIESYLYGLTNLKEIQIAGSPNSAQVLCESGATNVKPKYWTRDGILYGNNDSNSFNTYYLLKVPESKSTTNINMYNTGLTNDNILGANKIAMNALANNISNNVTLCVSVGVLSTIQPNAFTGSNIRSITFDSCVGFDSSSLDNAFTGATYLQSITIWGGAGGSSAYTSVDGWLKANDSDGLYYVPEYWGGSGSTLTINASIQNIEQISKNNIFYGNKSINKLVINDKNSSITRFNPETLLNIENLKSIDFSNEIAGYVTYGGVLYQNANTTTRKTLSGYKHYWDAYCAGCITYKYGADAASIVNFSSTGVNLFNRRTYAFLQAKYATDSSFSCRVSILFGFKCPTCEASLTSESNFVFILNDKVEESTKTVTLNNYNVAYVPRGLTGNLDLRNEKINQNGINIVGVKQKAFYYTSLTYVYLPDSIISGGIAEKSFYYATSNLERIYLSNFTSDGNGVMQFSDNTISNGLFGQKNTKTLICVQATSKSNSIYLTLYNNSSMYLSGYNSTNMIRFYFKEKPSYCYNEWGIMVLMKCKASYGGLNYSSGLPEKYSIRCPGCEKYYSYLETNDFREQVELEYIGVDGLDGTIGYCRNCIITHNSDGETNTKFRIYEYLTS